MGKMRIQVPAAADADMTLANVLGENECFVVTAYDGGRGQTVKKDKEDKKRKGIDKEGK